MANGFSKEERVAFENMLEGFQDALVLSKNVAVYNTDQTMMERAADTIWRPQPYIAQSFAGTDMTANFVDQTQLSVPATIGFGRSVPWILTASELRDELQEGRLGQAAYQKLASDINVAVLDVASKQGSLVVKRTTAATGFDDVALADSLMNEQGVPMWDRAMALSSRDYNSMAGNLAARQTLQGKPLTAYDKAFVGTAANFDLLKMDYALTLTAATGSGITMSTLTAANNYWIPKATSTAVTGETSNVDNRFQTITVSSTTNVKAGDAFTIAGVTAVHAITKGDTGQLRTFRVVSVTNGTQMVITPAIVSGQGGTAAEAAYKNVNVAQSGTAALVWLNTVSAAQNVFWQRDAIEILPGRYAVPTDAGAAVMRGTTDQGFELVMTKQFDINTLRTRYRVDAKYGVVNKQPMMSGICIFNQV